MSMKPRFGNGKSQTRRPRPFSHTFPYDYGVKHFPGDGDRSISKRRRICPSAVSLELPLLPFNMNEVLVPSESKTLHLYEARYLALLEELDPIAISNSRGEASFAARYGCLVLIQLDVGALVSIRGIGRVKIIKFLQADPYLKGEVRPQQDMVLDSTTNITSKVLQVKEALHSLNKLEIKLKAPKGAPLQTSCLNSLTWAENELSLECDKDFVPSSAERVSFAAFQPVSGSTQSELLKLQEEKLKAMKLKDTVQRIDNSLELIKESTSTVAAKLAIQSLEMQ
ncbi:ATP-dependent protease La domain-containing protein isoform 2 [Theobroma cacao]|uniref:ATP-dependent protease La domain-containing protein isoform 2 n=1 Tax=Theobroma cacao TaxID=3641 RepID=A0A061FJV2_THECC|nr:ATP-dependent protease La domain-containing protein isoform 2 [Theobroma cacao]